MADRARFHAHMKATGGKVAETHNSGTCHICGARAMYVARFHHLPSNTYITTGLDCAEKMGIDDPMAFKSFRKRAKAGLAATAGKRKAQKLLEDAQLGDVWAKFVELTTPLPAGVVGRDERLPRQEEIILDVVHGVIRYGNLSEGREKLLANVWHQITVERPAKQAARAAEMIAAEPVPVTDERVTITGKIVSTKTTESRFGIVSKMLVVTDAGYKVYGTIPAEFMNEVSKTGEHNLRGFRVQFCAKLERSKDDDKFGFFSRPTKPVILERAPVKDIGEQKAE